MIVQMGSDPNSDGDKSSEGRDDDERDPQRLSEGQELNDFRHAGVMSLVGPVIPPAQNTLTGVCRRERTGSVCAGTEPSSQV